MGDGSSSFPRQDNFIAAASVCYLLVGGILQLWTNYLFSVDLGYFGKARENLLSLRIVLVRRNGVSTA